MRALNQEQKDEAEKNEACNKAGFQPFNRGQFQPSSWRSPIDWLVVWNIFIFPYIGYFSILIDELICFRGVGFKHQPVEYVFVCVRYIEHHSGSIIPLVYGKLWKHPESPIEEMNGSWEY